MGRKGDPRRTTRLGGDRDPGKRLRPREEVFAYLADVANHPEFTDHFLKDWRLTREDSEGRGAGARPEDRRGVEAKRHRHRGAQSRRCFRDFYR